jgi:hypothetical protein
MSTKLLTPTNRSLYSFDANDGLTLTDWVAATWLLEMQVQP